MKKLVILLTAIIGLGLLYSCEEEEKGPVLQESNAPTIQAPGSGSDIVFTEETADDTITFEWSAASFNLNNLPNATYTLQMDRAGNDFASFKVIGTPTSETSITTTVGESNQFMLSQFEMEAGVPEEFEIRVKASTVSDSETDDLYSAVSTMTITTYEEIIIVEPIYMLGSATDAGWDNTLALEMHHVEDAKFEIVAHLLADEMIKFISILGSWAPQWGAETGSTWEAGTLAYRPTEDDPDPDPVPSPPVEGDYRVIADTANLTYEILPVTSELYVLGDATDAGWDNTAALEMTKTAPGQFTITTTLTGGDDIEGFKFIEVPGQWAPMWGTDENGTTTGGSLVYRETESDPDPMSLPAPTTGTYTINVDLGTRTYELIQE